MNAENYGLSLLAGYIGGFIHYFAVTGESTSAGIVAAGFYLTAIVIQVAIVNGAM